MDAKGELTSDDLDKLINDETILEVSIFNKLGQVDRALSTDYEKSQGASRSEAVWIQENLAPLINKTSDLLILGVDQREDKFMVAIPRDRGGVIACQLSVEAEQDFKYLTAMESALEDLLHVKGLKYLQLALDTQEPYFVAKDGKNVWYEVILIDRSHPQILADKLLKNLVKKKGRVYRGLTSAGRKTRHLDAKGKGTH